MFYPKKIYFKLISVLLMTLLIEKANAQDFFLNEAEDGWIPTMLQSKASTYFQSLQFNGYSVGWKYRGFENNSITTINGIEWNNQKLGIDLGAAMLGIYSLSRIEKTTTGFEPYENGLATSAVMRYVNLHAIDFSKSISVSNRFQPINGIYQSNFVWSTGKFKKSWHSQFKWQHEQSFIQYPAIGKRAVNGFAFSIDRIFPKNQYLSISFWFNDRYQTKSSPTVMEAIQLSGNNRYNPGWGWSNGSLVFANAKTSKLPMMQVQYTRQLNERNRFQMGWAVATGVQSVDGLDWTSVKDPRPDYYKYLPSFYKDSLLANQLINYYKEQPANLQLNFDVMKRVNQSNLNKRSYYILNRENAAIQLVQQAVHYYADWTERVQFSFHYNSIYESIEKNNTILDLLGGNYFLNYNSWVSDEDASIFQFDINQPDQKIKEGGSWGAHYSVKNIDQQMSALMFWQSARIESSIGFGYGLTYFQREGFNQNGLFPSSSLGKSTWYFFPSQKIQWQLIYKYSPRMYVKLNSLLHQDAPNWNIAFKNIAMRDDLSEYLLPLHQMGLNIGLYYLGIQYKTEVQLFGYQQKNQFGRSSFYHDFYNAFVQANYGLLNSNKIGAECSVETQFSSILNYQLGIGWGSYTIRNNPIYTIQSLGTDYPLESGNLHLAGLPETSTPELVFALSAQAQLSNTFRMGFSSIFSWGRKMEFDYFRRSFLWEKKITAPASMPNGFITNLFINKNSSFKFKGLQHLFKCYLQIQNILNQQNPVFAFEQSRYDYKNLNALKFAPKYLLGYPLNASIQVIYQIN